MQWWNVTKYIYSSIVLDVITWVIPFSVNLYFYTTTFKMYFSCFLLHILQFSSNSMQWWNVTEYIYSSIVHDVHD